MRTVALRQPHLKGMLGDGHCHLGCLGDEAGPPSVAVGIDTIDENIENIIVVLNGTDPTSWPHVLVAKSTRGTCLPQVGLHPWLVPADRADVDAALATLRRLLEERPGVGLGECGLDKSGKWAATFDAQLHAFKQQVAMAVDLGRPLSVHCVQCTFQVFEIVKEDVCGRVPVLLHGWSGSAEMTRAFGRLNVYFSLNLTLLNRHARKKAIEMVREIPSDRIVLESDGPDGRLRSRDDWAAWFRECGARCPSGGDGGDPLDFRDADIDLAMSRGSPASVKLMAHAVGAAVGRSPRDIMATSVENIRRIFVFTTTVCKR